MRNTTDQGQILSFREFAPVVRGRTSTGVGQDFYRYLRKLIRKTDSGCLDALMGIDPDYPESLCLPALALQGVQNFG